MAIQSVPLEKAYRLLNHGPTVLVSAKHQSTENVMAASWACALEFSPAKVTVVLDKMVFTRSLVEQSGWFALQVPVAQQAQMVVDVGSESLKDYPNKLNEFGVKLFYKDGFQTPLVEGCVAWLLCKLIPEPHNQEAHDLFIGEVVSAWADDRVFKDGHWQFDDVPIELKTLHYIAGGQFYVIGQGLKVNKGP
ncbi:flavin reductase family protein [Acinetobacter baumannii]|uniref:flavin reductase family protein n=1 Tax=Acinetobacter TaxID=469 RepID=UPI0021CDAD03|nr:MULTISPECIES: flavin reductase family protein [unclassified Acinetobacter]MCU4530912.1 flavin reductase family protein [Acinetobacter sp. WU_MDCI_Abxe169]MDC0842990.1 flavin reductase family protein [Acinetobacter sp. P1(2023)]